MKLARLSLTALFLGALACSSVQQVRDPVQFMATRPDLVVVIYDDRSEVPVAQPEMRGDTLFGTWQGLSEPVAVPLSQVQRIDAIQRDSKRTTLLIVGLATAGAVMTYGFSRLTANSGIFCSWDRGVDDRGDSGDLARERCFTSGI
jgi:hypothetical protein